MHERVVARGELAEIAEQRVRVAGAHHLDQVVDDIFEAFGQLRTGDVFKQAFQERV